MVTTQNSCSKDRLEEESKTIGPEGPEGPEERAKSRGENLKVVRVIKKYQLNSTHAITAESQTKCQYWGMMCKSTNWM